MAFEKGNKEHLKGERGKGVKSLQWEALGDAITGEHADKFNEILNEYATKNPEKFLTAYLQVLNYFKPKYQSTNLNIEEGFVFNVKVPGEE